MHDHSSHKVSPTGATLNDLVANPSHVETLRAAKLDSLDALFAARDGLSLNKPGLDGWRARVRLSLPTGSGEKVYFLKRFDQPPARAIRALRRSSRGASSFARNEWTWIQRLTDAGVPCLKAAAMGEELRSGREVRSAILTALVPGQSLESWCKTWTPADQPTIRAIIPALAAIVARMHAAGYFHRDLYLCHIFFDPSRPIEESLRLIDLQRVIQPMWRKQRWAIKDLAALNHSAPAGLVSRTDRLRFLKTYLGRFESTVSDTPLHPPLPRGEKGGLSFSARREMKHKSTEHRASAKVFAYLVIGKTASIARRDRGTSA